MRVAAQVLATYALLLLLGALWRYLPFERAAPDVMALSAIYLGLSARYRLAPSMAGAVVLGYLADLLYGSPQGLLAFCAGAVCLCGHFVQGRLLVRGWMFTATFAAFAGLLSGALVLALRLTVGLSTGGPIEEASVLGLSALFTGAVGPLVFRVCRHVDGRLARTQRERDLALEGLVP